MERPQKFVYGAELLIERPLKIKIDNTDGTAYGKSEGSDKRFGTEAPCPIQKHGQEHPDGQPAQYGQQRRTRSSTRKIFKNGP